MVQFRTTLEWVYEHYLVYLHLCIADSDCVVTERELSKIENSVFPLFDKARANSLVKEIYLEFIAHNEEEKRQIIQELAPKFLRTLSIRTKVLENLKGKLNQDEGCEEQLMFRFIESAIQKIK